MKKDTHESAKGEIPAVAASAPAPSAATQEAERKLAESREAATEAVLEAEAEAREQRLKDIQKSEAEGEKAAKKAESAQATEEKKNAKDAPRLEGTVLHFRGKELDLKQFEAQQWREGLGGSIVYEFLSGGAVAATIEVRGPSEAAEVEAVCNLYFRGF